MANIVELRGMSDDRLSENIENAREELFNLRFQKAFAQLDNHARIRTVRRELAQLESVLHMRMLAVEAATEEPDIAAALSGKRWQANAHFEYEDSAWQVVFNNENGSEIATALVNLNQKRNRSRAERAKKEQRPLVTSYEIVE
ncbi:MAG: 50S ribosomal protein L29 [Candidatus Promineifilaceae bacterium]